MIFIAEVDRRPYQIEVQENKSGWEVSLTNIKTGKKEVHCLSKQDYQQFGELISFIFKQRSYLIDIMVRGDEYTVFTKGTHKTIHLLSEERNLYNKWAGSAKKEGELVIKSGMPGKVMELHVQPHSQVQEGDLLLTISAMKMENEIRAEKSGKVKKIYVRPSQNVETGASLLSLEVSAKK